MSMGSDNLPHPTAVLLSEYAPSAGVRGGRGVRRRQPTGLRRQYLCLQGPQIELLHVICLFGRRALGIPLLRSSAATCMAMHQPLAALPA